MRTGLEWKKLKRTGYLPAFLAAGLLASSFPVIQTAVREETFTTLSGSPFQILMNANWQMMAMLNILWGICGCCMMYHTEFADHGQQKMETLPVGEGSLFLGKFFVTALASLGILTAEITAIYGCKGYWFSPEGLKIETFLKNLGFQTIVFLPTGMFMLVIASLCKNMWTSLGLGVILVFAATMLPQESLDLGLLPFAAPYQTFFAVEEQGKTGLVLLVCGLETVGFALLEMMILKIRRYLR